eukprot:UN12783
MEPCNFSNNLNLPIEFCRINKISTHICCSF